MLVTSRDPFRIFDRQLNWPTTPLMPVDVIRREHELELRVDMPGVTADQLDVTVEQRVLTITAARETAAGDGESFAARERRSGTSRRSFNLSPGLDASSLQASLDAGVLSIRIPMAEAAKPQKVHVEVASVPAIEATAN